MNLTPFSVTPFSDPFFLKMNLTPFSSFSDPFFHPFFPTPFSTLFPHDPFFPNKKGALSRPFGCHRKMRRVCHASSFTTSPLLLRDLVADFSPIR